MNNNNFRVPSFFYFGPALIAMCVLATGAASAAGVDKSISFKGAGKCGVPGAAYGKSAHMQFEVAGESGEPIIVSVFVAPISADMPMEPGKTYAIDMSACGISGYSVLAWTDGVANYFLVADEGTDGCGQTLKAAGRPEPTEKI